MHNPDNLSNPTAYCVVARETATVLPDMPYAIFCDQAQAEAFAATMPYACEIIDCHVSDAYEIIASHYGIADDADDD